MPLFNDYYEMLGIDPSATRDEIKRAYRRRALESHPDLHQNPPDSQTEEMRLLNEAYKTLSHPLKRTGYDIDWNNYYRQRGMVSSRRSDSDTSGSASVSPARTSARFEALDVFLLTVLIVLSIVLGIMIAGRVRQRLQPGPPVFPRLAPPQDFQGSEGTFSIPDPSGRPVDV